jgi:hypothetical protein
VRKLFGGVKTMKCLHSVCACRNVTPEQGNLLSAAGLVPACIMLVYALSE